MPVEAKRSIANDAGPHPQRGWSSVGIEQTSKLRGENLNGGSGDELIDDRVSKLWVPRDRNAALLLGPWIS